MGKELLGSLELNRVYQFDCVEGMRLIPDKSINLICIDPPYNIGKDNSWDKWETSDGYIVFMSEVFKECERVLVDNGSFYFFHNDFEQMAELQVWLKQNTRFVFNSFVVWDKGDFRALSWKNPSEHSNLKSWFNTCEYVMYYTFQDNVNSKTIKDDFVANNNPFRKEITRARKEAGLSITQVAEKGKFYGKVNHGGAVTNWEKGYNIPLKDQWELMKSFLPINVEYEELREEYEALLYTHNLDKNHNNVWRYNTENKGKYHACQKPLSIIERIIKTSSNEGDIVLDCFGGSGTTFLASERLNRKWIGFEREPKYIEITNQRLEAVQDEIAEQKLMK